MNLNFTKEEKILAFVPILFMWIDYVSTIVGANNITVLFYLERNISFKMMIYEHGGLGLLAWLIFVQVVLFIAAIAAIRISKLYGISIKYIYTLMFLYGGFRIDGALSWFI